MDPRSWRPNFRPNWARAKASPWGVPRPRQVPRIRIPNGASEAPALARSHEEHRRPWTLARRTDSCRGPTVPGWSTRDSAHGKGRSPRTPIWNTSNGGTEGINSPLSITNSLNSFRPRARCSPFETQGLASNHLLIRFTLCLWPEIILIYSRTWKRGFEWGIKQPCCKRSLGHEG